MILEAAVFFSAGAVAGAVLSGWLLLRAPKVGTQDDELTEAQEVNRVLMEHIRFLNERGGRPPTEGQQHGDD